MSGPLNTVTDADKMPVSTTLPAVGGPLLQLPVELLIAIVVALNDEYLEDSLCTIDPLSALRL
jgi:hypothetical protein